MASLVEFTGIHWQGSQVLFWVIILDEESSRGFKLLGTRAFVNDDFAYRAETPLLAFRGNGNGIPRSTTLVLLPEASLAIDQVDLLEVEHELVLMDRYKQVVGLGGAPDQSAVSDLLDAGVPGAGDGVHFTAKIEVDSMLRHGFPKVRVASLDGQHAG
jgi:hypothetical protein